MFRLNDAVRRYRAQHRSPTELRCVAASVTTLSPPAKRDAAGVVATVASATPEPIDLAQLIEQLQEEGALLLHSENALFIRPAHWGQLDSVSAHWKALLRFLQTNVQGEDNGAGRSA
ncbi:TPA: hypothetical protein ACM2ZG_001751 [Pseudomonas aeruginosa]|uniref:hypothetical protein n=1 Tax=Pseudomonas aeruginosa TaxID=287 RepID=UPI003004CD26